MTINEFYPNYLRDGTEAMSEGEMRQAGARIHVTNEMVTRALPNLHHWIDPD
jgi:hypothetical protein